MRLQPSDRRIETRAQRRIHHRGRTFPTRGIFGGQGRVIDLIAGEKPARHGAGAVGRASISRWGVAAEAAVAADFPAR